MAESKSAKYQRAFRERMRHQGLVSKLVYIRPEHAPLLSRVEKALQRPGAQIQIQNDNKGESQTMGTKWTTASLFEALKSSPLASSGQATVELLEGAEPAINLTMHEYGDLPIEVAASGEQLFCSTPLWDEDQVKDRAAFNEGLLLINPISPLSNFGLIQLEDGRKQYIVFGELSAQSELAQVVEEVEVLARNTLEAAEAFSSELNQ
jgi:uncharacterized protein YjfI (DUF2170 family)